MTSPAMPPSSGNHAGIAGLDDGVAGNGGKRDLGFLYRLLLFSIYWFS